MNWIQVLLIAAVLVLLVYLLASRRKAQARAWVKVGYVLFVIAAVYAIVRPDDTTVVAHWLGIGRGADLLEYAFIVAFLFATISAYMRFKDLELRYARLARAVALEGAREPADQ
jgi:small membrane protein